MEEELARLECLRLAQMAGHGERVETVVGRAAAYHDFLSGRNEAKALAELERIRAFLQSICIEMPEIGDSRRPKSR